MPAKRSLSPACPDTLPLPFETNDAAQAQAAKPFPLEPLTVRIPVAVRLTGIGRSKLYELIKSGEVEIVKVGGSTLIPYSSLVGMIERARGRAR